MKKSEIAKRHPIFLEQEKLISLKYKCKKISNVSKSIRYVGIINLHGRTLTGKINSGTKPLFSPNQVREEFFAIATSVKIRKKSLTVTGKTNYVIYNHDKVIILLLPNKDVIYYITFGPKSIPSKSIIEKIRMISTEE